MDHHGHCPECGADWAGEDIFTVLRKQDWCKNKSDAELHVHIQESYAPPYKFSRIIGVELPYDHPDHYDGVSYWECPDCKHKFPRFAKGVRP
jgi:rubredoxin